jgi:hypothetical protein
MDTYFRNRYCPCLRCKLNDLTWPVMFIAFGIMQTLDNNFYQVRNGMVWGVCLITFGVVRVLQSSADTEGHRQPGTVAPGTIPPVPPSSTPSAPGVTNG